MEYLYLIDSWVQKLRGGVWYELNDELHCVIE